MIRFIGRRVGLSVIVVAGVIVITFFLTHVIPGDPAVSWAGPHASAAAIERARVQLGLNLPWWRQVVHYFGGVLSGNWGTSIRTHRPVLSDLMQAIPASIELVGAALVIAIVLGVPLGLVAARFRGRPPDHLARALSVFGVSMPPFWLALILQLIFFHYLNLLPGAGEYTPSLAYNHPLSSITGIPVIDALFTGNWTLFTSSLTHLVLPALAVAAYPVGVIARMVRAKVSEASEETHSQMARALGFSERSVLGRFALRLAWNPVLQVLALVFAYSLVNTFLVESVFDWPGLGSYAANAVSALDVPAIAGITLFVAIAYVILNLAVDIAQAFFDPRIRLR
ncbi:MAG TPA: ABC transporter permease [Acidimicrobiales bacterium]|nr:ABC transporter permease [Acidimicrobiales bacterium]